MSAEDYIGDFSNLFDFGRIEEEKTPDYLRRFEKKRINMNTKAMKKFYVGTNKVFIPGAYSEKTWAKNTLGEAIAHARQILDEKPDQEFAFVVKVVAVIKRKNQPIIVEMIK